MDNKKYFVVSGDEAEIPQTGEEKAAEEKASRRQRYIYARVAADNLAKSIQRIESGASSQVDSLEALRAQLAHSRIRVAQFEAEFIDDPDIERDVRLEIQATEDIAKTFFKKMGIGK